MTFRKLDLFPSSGVGILPFLGRRHIGKTDRFLTVRLREHRHNPQQGLLEKSKLAQHTYEEGHRVTASIENTRNRPIWPA
jgi:hypothetical protein